jgi:signal transduction histidine kinase/DNA-binding response OmpR family regulator
MRSRRPHAVHTVLALAAIDNSLQFALGADTLATALVGTRTPHVADFAKSRHIDYVALFRDSPGACLVVAADYTIVDVNEAYLHMTLGPREDLVGENYFDAFPVRPGAPNLEQANEIKTAFARVFATGRASDTTLIRYAIPIASVEGEGFIDALWNTSYHPITDDAGRVAFVFQIVHDVSNLRETVVKAAPAVDATPDDHPDAIPVEVIAPPTTREGIDRSPESDRLRLLRLFDQSLSFTVFMREPEHIVELANPAYLKMVGEEDLHDRRYGNAHRSEPPVPIKLLDAVYESGVPIIEHGLALRVPDGDGGMHTIYVDVVIQQIVDIAGKTLGVFMQGNDVTMAKATQDELSAYRTRLEEMVAERTRALERSESERRNAEAALHRAQRLEAVGKLTGGVAHDFNNVLQIIRGNLQLIERNYTGDGKMADRIEAALDGVDRGAKLASQLLAFGRRQSLDPIVVDLEDVLRRMEDLLHRALGESIHVKTHVSEGLWNTLVDVTRLENVILNIAINARDAMDHRGSLSMELQNAVVDDLHARNNEGLNVGDYVILAISDSGSGMTPEVQRRAFEPFFTTKAEGEGTGLGLSMVYGFMKQSGGHVTLYSEEGHGTTIRLYLPRSEDALTDTSTAPIATPVRGNGESILVVEDDEAVRVTVIETLTELGYRVLRAVDGQSALSIIRSGAQIDLLFTDVIMPGPVASTEMVRQARLLLPQMRVLFTSGFTRDAIVDRDRLRPGVNLLSKPYAREDLARRLRQLLDEDLAGHGSLTTTPPPTIENEPVVHKPVEPADGASLPSTARRVLLVEDSQEVRETTVEFINEVGFEVVAVGTAEAALEAMATARYDIVFTDISLPGISGIELLKRARQADPQQRVVVASGYGADLGKHGFGPGVAVLSKPYDLAALERTLNEVLAAVVPN